MAVDRKGPTYGVDGPTMTGQDALDQINEEIAALWGYVGGVLASVAGTANAITANCPVPITAYTDGLQVTLIPSANNTAATTLALNGLAAKDVLDASGNPIVANALVSARAQPLVYRTADNGFRFDGAHVTGALQTHGSVVVGNIQANTVAGGTATSGSWLDYTLNTVLQNDLSGEGASLGSNIVTLPKGIYDVYAFVPFYLTQLSRLRLLNSSDSTVVASVMSSTTRNTTTNDVQCCQLMGRLELTTTKNMKLQYRVSTTRATDGLGLPMSISETEKYGMIAFVRRPGTQLDLGTIASHNLTISASAPSGGNDGDLWAVI